MQVLTDYAYVDPGLYNGYKQIEVHDLSLRDRETATCYLFHISGDVHIPCRQVRHVGRKCRIPVRPRAVRYGMCGPSHRVPDGTRKIGCDRFSTDILSLRDRETVTRYLFHISGHVHIPCRQVRHVGRKHRMPVRPRAVRYGMCGPSHRVPDGTRKIGCDRFSTDIFQPAVLFVCSVYSVFE
jgi:hypothetical protein